MLLAKESLCITCTSCWLVLKKEACRRCQEYAFLPKRRALKGDNIYSDDDLDPTLVAHTKKTCHECSIHEMKTNGLYI